MRIKITILVCVAVVAALLGLSYHTYKNHQAIAAAHRSQLQSQVDKRVDTLQAANADMIKKYNALWEECQKGVVAYKQLPASASNLKLTMPNCGLSILE